MMVFALTKTLSPCFIRINEVFYFFDGGSRPVATQVNRFNRSPISDRRVENHQNDKQSIMSLHWSQEIYVVIRAQTRDTPALQTFHSDRKRDQKGLTNSPLNLISISHEVIAKLFVIPECCRPIVSPAPAFRDVKYPLTSKNSPPILQTIESNTLSIIT